MGGKLSKSENATTPITNKDELKGDIEYLKKASDYNDTVVKLLNTHISHINDNIGYIDRIKNLDNLKKNNNNNI